MNEIKHWRGEKEIWAGMIHTSQNVFDLFVDLSV